MIIFEIILGIVIISVVSYLVITNKEKIIEGIRRRTEKNAVKIPNVTWREKNGRTHTEDIVIKRSMIPFIGDWARIYPVVKEEKTGNFWSDVNWLNAIFGGKKNFIKLVIILIIVGLVLFAFAEIFYSYAKLKEICELPLSLI